MHADRDLAVADLAQRARVLALHPRRVLTVLRDSGVIDDPGQHSKLGRDPLRAGARNQLRLPRRVGQKLLHRLVAGRRLLEPKQRRLQTLASALLDQSAHIGQSVLPLTHMRKRRNNLRNEIGEPLTRLHRRHLNRDRCSHHCLPRR